MSRDAMKSWELLEKVDSQLVYRKLHNLASGVHGGQDTDVINAKVGRCRLTLSKPR
jgi:hypothetical protein